MRLEEEESLVLIAFMGRDGEEVVALGEEGLIDLMDLMSERSCEWNVGCSIDDGSVEDLRRKFVSRGGLVCGPPCRLELEMEKRWTM